MHAMLFAIAHKMRLFSKKLCKTTEYFYESLVNDVVLRHTKAAGSEATQCFPNLIENAGRNSKRNSSLHGVQ